MDLQQQLDTAFVLIDGLEYRESLGLATDAESSRLDGLWILVLQLEQAIEIANANTQATEDNQ